MHQSPFDRAELPDHRSSSEEAELGYAGAPRADRHRFEQPVPRLGSASPPSNTMIRWIGECNDHLLPGSRIKDNYGHGQPPEPNDRKLNGQAASVPVNASLSPGAVNDGRANLARTPLPTQLLGAFRVTLQCRSNHPTAASGKTTPSSRDTPFATIVESNSGWRWFRFSAHRCTRTGVPTLTLWKRSRTSSLSIRTQPADAKVPIDDGRLVP